MFLKHAKTLRNGLTHYELQSKDNAFDRKGYPWSRRISAHDRIIYDIYEDVITVLVLEVEGHYNDK